MDVLDLDLSSTWPRHLREIVESVAKENPEYMFLDSSKSNLIPDVIRWKILDSFADAPIAVYHATKLLEHEIESVNSLGLQAVSKIMLTARITQALSHECITAVFAKYLIDHGLRSASESNREGKISVFTSRLALRRKYGLQRQFNLWGGEALRNKFEDGHDVFETLRSIGEPAVVKGFVNLESQEGVERYFFDLTFNLLKVWGGGPERDQKGGQFTVASLPSDRILEVIIERLNPEEWADLAPMSESPEEND